MAYVGKGLGAIKDAMNSSADIVKIKNGESKVIRIVSQLEDIISVWEHVEQLSGGWHTVTCLGRADCPLCKAGKKASFRSYIVVADRDDNNKVKVLKASKKVGVQILGLVDEYGDIRARDFKMSRTGDKLDTTYQFFPRDRSDFDFDSVADSMPDIEAMIQPKSREDIIALMAGGVVSDNAEDTDSPISISDDDLPF